MNIIGLGKAGCKIVDLFSEYPQYKIFKFDSDKELEDKENCYNIPFQQSAELYDANPMDLSNLSNELDEDEEVYFVLCGSGKVSACTLWILKSISDRKINIVYIKPDTSTMDNKSVLRNRAHFHILQEYTRSGVFNKMFIFDNNSLSNIVGKTSILNFYPKINQLVATSIHWLNIYRNSDTVFDTFGDKYISSRIATLSVINLDLKQDLDCYDIKNVNQIEYFFGVNRTRIEDDEELFDTLVEISSSDSEGKSISFGVYSTDLEEGFSFCLKSSSEIQSE